MIVLLNELTEEKQTKREECVKKSQTLIMYLQNHGSEDNRWDEDELEPWIGQNFNK